MSPAIPPFFAWVPLACLAAALAVIAVAARRNRPRRPDSWLRDFAAEARDRDRRNQ